MKRLTAIAIVLLWSGLVMAAPQPYVPQAGDLSNKDQPNAATVRQVQNRSESFRPAPATTPPRATSSPAPANANRFQPKPYVPHPDDLPGNTTPAPPIVATRPESAPAPQPTPTPPVPAPVPAPPVPTPAPTPTPDPVPPKPAPVTPPVTAPASQDENKAQVNAIINKALAAYGAKDCPGLLALFHTQAYVLVRNPWGEQGSLGHQQLREAHCADVSNPKTPAIQLKDSRVEIIANDRAKAWGQLNARVSHQGQMLDIPAGFEADLVKENNAWLITDAIIQYDAP